MKRLIEKLKWWLKIGWECTHIGLADEWWALRYEYRNKKTGEIREVIYD